MTITTGSVSPGNAFALNDKATTGLNAVRSALAGTNTNASSAGAFQTAEASSSNAAGGGTASGSTGGATVSASDFLQLLVSELQNQDPTQPTDPNTYVQQLVGVNSLQQLIQINQTLTGASSASATNQTAAAGSI